MSDIEYVVMKTHEEPDLAKLAEVRGEQKPVDLTETQIDLIDWEDQTFYFPDGSQMTADEQDLYFDFMWHPEKYPDLVPQIVNYADTYALPASGQISMSQIRTEVGGSGQCSLNDANFRALINKNSGQQQAMSEYRGKASGPVPGWVDYDVQITGGTQGSSESNNSYGTTKYAYVYGGSVTVYNDGGYTFSSFQHGGYNYLSTTFGNSSAGGVKQANDTLLGWAPKKTDNESNNVRHYRNGAMLSNATNTWTDYTTNPLRYWALNTGSYNAVQNPVDYRATHK